MISMRDCLIRTKGSVKPYIHFKICTELVLFIELIWSPKQSGIVDTLLFTYYLRAYV